MSDQFHVARTSKGLEHLNTLVVKWQSLLVVTDLEPEELEDCTDEFVVTSTRGPSSYRQSIKPAGDHLVVDDQICVEFEGLDPRSAYTLVIQKEDGDDAVIFEDVPYTELVKLSDDLDAEAVEPE